MFKYHMEFDDFDSEASVENSSSFPNFEIYSKKTKKLYQW